MNYLIKLVILFSIMCFSCQNKNDSLNGHWHFFKENAFPEDFNRNIDFILDISNNTNVLYNNGIGGFNGTFGFYDKSKKSIYIGGECLYIHLKIDKIDNYVKVKKLDDGVDYFGWKCNLDCCDKEAEFFKDSPLDINLPINNHPKLVIELKNKRFGKTLEFGVTKKYRNGLYYKKPKMSNGHNLLTFEDLKWWKEKQLIKIPKKYHDNIYSILYVDNNVRIKETKKLLDSLYSLGEENIFLAVNNNTSNKFRVSYIKLDNTDLGNDRFKNLNIQDYINQYAENIAPSVNSR